jgi:hypothetical protein
MEIDLFELFIDLWAYDIFSNYDMWPVPCTVLRSICRPNVHMYMYFDLKCQRDTTQQKLLF